MFLGLKWAGKESSVGEPLMYYTINKNCVLLEVCSPIPEGHFCSWVLKFSKSSDLSHFCQNLNLLLLCFYYHNNKSLKSTGYKLTALFAQSAKICTSPYASGLKPMHMLPITKVHPFVPFSSFVSIHH